jgi:hypothetical protein
MYDYTLEVAESWVVETFSGTLSEGSEDITVRYYQDGNSVDEIIELCDKGELAIRLQGVAFALLKSIIEGRDGFYEVNAQLNFAEILLHEFTDEQLEQWLPEDFTEKHGGKVHVNFYTTFYCPVAKFLRDHKV